MVYTSTYWEGPGDHPAFPVPGQDASGERTWQYRGNSSEAPIVVAARKVGLPEDIVSQQLGATDWSIGCQFFVGS